jgi:uncharacterized protein YjbI with pentapeptide repeats
MSVMKRTIADKGRKTAGWLATTLALSLGAACVPPDADPNDTRDNEVKEHVSALAGVNLAGVNLAGVNLAGVNLAGVNLAGVNLAGVNMGGTNLAGVNLAGVNLAGVNLAGVNLAGVNLAGVNLAASNLGGSTVPGSNPSGNIISGTTLAVDKLTGQNSGSNIYGVASTNAMLYSREDLRIKSKQCIVMGIGSTAFAKLLGQQGLAAKIYVALGKLPWGFSATSMGPVALDAWEAIMWGDKTYCSFVMAAPPGTPWSGVAGFIKAVYRWNAPPSQSMDISGIDASSTQDGTVDRTVKTYTGMMGAAANFRVGAITEQRFVAGLLAFATATTNNQTVMVDFSTWIQDRYESGIVLGNVQSSSPPQYAEAVYMTVDNGDGTVGILIGDAAPPSLGAMPSGMKNSMQDIGSAYTQWLAGTGPKPSPRRCAGALYLNKYFGEPMPPGKCDAGIAWASSTCIEGHKKWNTVWGTTFPMNSYMLMTQYGGRFKVSADGGTCVMKEVLSATYMHMWDKNYDFSYEAEASTNTRAGAVVAQTSSFSSGDTKMGYIGHSPSNYLIINDVYAPTAGTYTLNVYGSTWDSRSFKVSVNGGLEQSITLTGTNWLTTVSSSMAITLAEGNNDIKFFNDTAWAPDLDRIGIMPPP